MRRFNLFFYRSATGWKGFPFGKHYIIKRKLFPKKSHIKKLMFHFSVRWRLIITTQDEHFNVFSTFAFWVTNPIKWINKLLVIQNKANKLAISFNRELIQLTLFPSSFLSSIYWHGSYHSPKGLKTNVINVVTLFHLFLNLVIYNCFLKII